MKIKDNPSELGAILALMEVRGLGPIKFKRIYEKLKSFEKLFELSQTELKENFGFGNSYIFKIERNFLSEFKDKIISENVRKKFNKNGYFISDNARVILVSSEEFKILDSNREYLIKKSNEKLGVYLNVISEILYKKDNLHKYYLKAEKEIKEADRLNAHIISFCDDEYPPNLYNSNQPVPLLYATGDLSVLKKSKFCAVVGTRKPSIWAAEETEKAVNKLILNDYVIVSGLATGIDEIAHRSALKYGGKTIAVLGCGVDISYPPQNLDLKKKIEKSGGAVISEYTFGTPIKDFRLKKRNKITVGLSECVLIAQTSKRGGTMNAYKAAIEQKKRVGVFYPPESLKNEFDGNLKIIEEKKTSVFKFTSGDSVNF